jgi:hypothetical protein
MAMLVLAAGLEAAGAEPLTPIHLSLVDGEAIAYATFQSHNQKVVANAHGIFLTHLRSANKDYTAQSWRLSRSTDGGRSFTTLYEATHATNPPALETDAAGNLYLVRPDFGDGHAYLCRFAAPEYRSPPAVSKVPGGSAGKYCLLLDPERKQLYYFAHNNTFSVVGLDGKVRASTTLLRPGTNAILQYPHLALGRDGTLYAAWTTSKPNTYLYWDIHAMRSRDGGTTWEKLDGNSIKIPVAADDSGATDRISRDDEFKVHSWLSAWRVQDRKLHLVYWAKTDPQRQRHVRYDAATGKRDLDHEPIFRDPRSAIPNDSGVLVSRSALDGSPLYFVSTLEDRTRPACLASDDNGASWYLYAVADRKFSHRVYSIGGARELTADGQIIGTFTDVDRDAKSYQEPGTGKVYFFRIQGGVARAAVSAVAYQEETLTVRFDRVRGQLERIRFSTGTGGWTEWQPFQKDLRVRMTQAPRQYQLKSRLGTVSPSYDLVVSRAERVGEGK